MLSGFLVVDQATPPGIDMVMALRAAVSSAITVAGMCMQVGGLEEQPLHPGQGQYRRHFDHHRPVQVGIAWVGQ